tara:strand:+ start:6757 stop:7308 length:552 start_codon:yes stop_codon:yes gene_type:complete
MENIKNIQIQKIFKYFIVIVFGSLVLALSAKIKIPFYPVPMTMQTFVVVLIGIAFGYKVGLATIAAYLLEGILGMPVFSNSPEKGVGLVYFTGPTMGYLLGFLTAVFLAGYFNYNNNFFKNFIKIIFCVSTIYVLGLIWLGFLIGWEKPIFKLGAEPFLLAELFKVLLLTLIASYTTRLRQFI